LKKYFFFLIIFCFLRFDAAAQEEAKWHPAAQDATWHPATWQDAKSTHFIVYYKNAPREFIDQLLDKAESYYNEIAASLGFNRYNFWLWDNRAKIYIYDGASDYRAATSQPGWSGGSAIIAEKVIHAYPGARNFLEEALPHEMGHIIFREFVGFHNSAVPLWLDEGVASYQQRSNSHFTSTLLQEAMKKGTFIKLQDLSGFNLNQVSDVALVQLFYSEAFSVVNFLVKEFGKDKFVLFCQTLRDKASLERAIASVYPFSNLTELNNAWERELKK
jgi:hypothetical protein